MKKTDNIKERLNTHRTMLEKLASLQNELEYARGQSLKIPKLTGMPSGGGLPGDPVNAIVERVDELKARIEQKRAEIDADWAEIEPLVELLQPAETLVINLRYLHGADWPEVCAAVFGRSGDYEVELDRYMNRTYKIHGKALLAMAKGEAELRQSTEKS